MADDSVAVRPAIAQPVSMAQYYNRPPGSVLPQMLAPASLPARRMLHHHNGVSKESRVTRQRPVDTVPGVALNADPFASQSSSDSTSNGDAAPNSPSSDSPAASAAASQQQSLGLRPTTPPALRMVHEHNKPLPPKTKAVDTASIHSRRESTTKKGCTVS